MTIVLTFFHPFPSPSGQTPLFLISHFLLQSFNQTAYPIWWYHPPISILFFLKARSSLISLQHFKKCFNTWPYCPPLNILFRPFVWTFNHTLSCTFLWSHTPTHHGCPVNFFREGPIHILINLTGTQHLAEQWTYTVALSKWWKWIILH